MNGYRPYRVLKGKAVSSSVTPPITDLLTPAHVGEYQLEGGKWGSHIVLGSKDASDAIL